MEEGVVAVLLSPKRRIEKRISELFFISIDLLAACFKPWIRLRDCISVGRERWKYDDAQLLYHYTRDTDVLSMELRRVRDDERRGLIKGSIS